MNSTSNQPFGTPMFALLSEAAEEAGFTTVEPPEETRAWIHPLLDGNNMEYAHPLFGSLQVQAEHRYRLCETEEGETNLRARLLCAIQQPRQLSFRLTAKAMPGVRVLYSKAGNFLDVTDREIPEFRVPVQWNKKEIDLVPREDDGHGNKSARRPEQTIAMVPHTRVRGQDNLDIVFLAENGMKVTLQVSLTTRADKFWLAIQETFCSQLVRTTWEKAREGNVRYHGDRGWVVFAVPMYPAFAAPNNDYLEVYRQMGPQVIDYALERGSVIALSTGKSVIAKWQPKWELSPELKSKGWKPAVVEYFNLVTGTGVVICEDGRECFVHFRQMLTPEGRPIANAAGFPVFEPGKTVAVKYNPEEQDRKASAARNL